MGDAALRLLSDPERWQQASEAARAVAVERFSSDLVVPQYEQYYRQVIERGTA
jgi:glycosyltransferase involved in cell wall biosynthesis